MARRFQEITEVYRQEIAALARADRWAAFLRSACRNYKLPFEEQVLVHAQRPDATAVLEIERWNRQFGRWVNKGATGIAVFDRDYPGRTRLKYSLIYPTPTKAVCPAPCRSGRCLPSRSRM